MIDEIAPNPLSAALEDQLVHDAVKQIPEPSEYGFSPSSYAARTAQARADAHAQLAAWRHGIRTEAGVVHIAEGKLDRVHRVATRFLGANSFKHGYGPRKVLSCIDQGLTYRAVVVSAKMTKTQLQAALVYQPGVGFTVNSGLLPVQMQIQTRACRAARVPQRTEADKWDGGVVNPFGSLEALPQSIKQNNLAPKPSWPYLAPGMYFTTQYQYRWPIVMVDELDVLREAMAIEDAPVGEREAKAEALKQKVASRIASPSIGTPATIMFMKVPDTIRETPRTGGVATPYESAWLQPVHAGPTTLMKYARALVDMFLQEQHTLRFYNEKSKHVGAYIRAMGQRLVYACGTFEIKRSAYYERQPTAYKCKGDYCWARQGTTEEEKEYPRKCKPTDSPMYALFLETQRLTETMLRPDGAIVPRLFLMDVDTSKETLAKEIDDDDMELVAVSSSSSSSSSGPASGAGSGSGSGSGGTGHTLGNKRGRDEPIELDSDGDFSDASELEMVDKKAAATGDAASGPKATAAIMRTIAAAVAASKSPTSESGAGSSTRTSPARTRASGRGRDRRRGGGRASAAAKKRRVG